MSRGAARSAYLSWLAHRLDGAPPSPPVAAAPRGGDLVLGYATGYRRPETEAFVRSLRAVHAGPAALFVDPDPGFRAWLADHEIEALDAAPSHGWTPLPVVARFADYARLLEARPGLGAVLLTDVRDVVFQSDPFAPRPAGLEVFVEDETRRLGQNRFHSKYLRALCGDALAATLEDRPCLCAGTIIGPAQDVARLCRLVLALCAIPRSSVGGGFGVDQAALQMAVHLGLIPAEIRPNHGRVATLGVDLAGTRLQDGRILAADGSASPIVHQYDRHPALMEAVRTRWSPDMPDRARSGPQGLSRARAKLKATLARYWPEAR